MELKQQLKLSQQLVMTPQLQQAIKLLQMTRMELTELVQDEMLENPILELHAEQTEHAQQAARADGNEGGTEGQGDVSTIDQQVDQDDRAMVDESKDKKDEIDWERYLENHAMQAPERSGSGGGRDDSLPSYESTLSVGQNLRDHLAWQLRMGDFLDEERHFGALVLGNLTDAGYLRIENVAVEDVVSYLAEEANLNAEDAEEVLKMMQRFDPIGVCSRSLAECLHVQAEHYGFDKLVLAVIDHHLGDFERRQYASVAKTLHIGLEEVYDIAQVIAELEPRPGRNFVSEEPVYSTPDVYVHRAGDDYVVTSNDDGVPRLKISGFYRSAMTDNPQAKEYIQNKLRSAQWLIRSIDQRRKTILRVTESIVEQQRAFFDKGIDFLRPMVLRDVAEAIEMHESTVSRVTTNKYVHTSWGIFELKYFFNSAIRRGNQEEIASESVKQSIKKMISSEDASAPYSDQTIVKMLAEKNIKIARRTVAKYREALGILSSSKRKKYF